MSFRTLIIIGIIMACGYMSVLFAETVRLVNGKVMTGKVLEMTDSIVRMEINGAEEIVRRDRVDSIALGDFPETKDIAPLLQTPKSADSKKSRSYAFGFEVAQDADPKLDPFGLSIYIQHIWDSGMGFQANLGVYDADVIADYGTDKHIGYTLPIIFSYHVFRDSVLSPYAGIGVSRSVYTSEKWGIWERERKSKKGFSPLADIGFAFGGDSPMQVVCNLKYFVSLYTSKANMLTIGAGVSINW